MLKCSNISLHYYQFYYEMHSQIFKTMQHLTKTKTFKDFLFHKNIVRLSSTTLNDNLSEWNKIKSKYSSSQLNSALKILKKIDETEMKKYAVPENFVKSLETTSLKKFKSLDDFISLDLLKADDLDAICSAVAKKNSRTSKTSSVLTCSMKKNILHNLKTVIGLRIGINFVSWSQLTLTGSNCNILKWDCQSISDVPLNADPIDLINTALKIAETIPDADAYVMEKESSKPLTKLNASFVKVQMRQQQMISVILTSLIIKIKTNVLESENEKNIMDYFYTIKSYAPAKLFGLLLGQEVVSSNEIVQQLFQQKQVKLKNISGVTLDDDVESYYATSNNFQKEELNKTLLLTLTFFESVVLEQR